jgi:hypothetical protein
MLHSLPLNALPDLDRGFPCLSPPQKNHINIDVVIRPEQQETKQKPVGRERETKASPIYNTISSLFSFPKPTGRQNQYSTREKKK